MLGKNRMYYSILTFFWNRYDFDWINTVMWPNRFCKNLNSPFAKNFSGQSCCHRLHSVNHNGRLPELTLNFLRNFNLFRNVCFFNLTLIWIIILMNNVIEQRQEFLPCETHGKFIEILYSVISFASLSRFLVLQVNYLRMHPLCFTAKCGNISTPSSLKKRGYSLSIPRFYGENSHIFHIKLGNNA